MTAIGALRRFDGTTWSTFGFFCTPVPSRDILSGMDPEPGQMVLVMDERAFLVFDGNAWVASDPAAPDYDENRAYLPGDCVWHEGMFYRASADIPVNTEPGVSADWVLTSSAGIDDFDPLKDYHQGDLVTHGRALWRAFQDVPAGQPVPQQGSVDWEQLQRRVLFVQDSTDVIDDPAQISDWYFDRDTKELGYLDPHVPDANDRTLTSFDDPANPVPADLATLKAHLVYGDGFFQKGAFAPGQYVLLPSLETAFYNSATWEAFTGTVTRPGLTRHELFSEKEIRQWIAESSRFRGAVEPNGGKTPGATELKNLPVAAPKNQGQYWVASNDIFFPIPGDRQYLDKKDDLAAVQGMPTADQIKAVQSLAALKTLIPPANLPPAYRLDWHTATPDEGWLLNSDSGRFTFDGTDWVGITTLPTMKAGDWLQSVGDPTQPVKGFTVIPGGVLTVSFADTLYVRRTESERLVPIAAADNLFLSSRTGQAPVWGPPPRNQGTGTGGKIIVSTMPPKPVGNEVLWTSIFTPVVFNSGRYCGTRNVISPGPTVADNQMNLTNGVLHISDGTGDWMDGTFYTGVTVGSLIRLVVYSNRPDADHRAEFLVTSTARDNTDMSWKFGVVQLFRGALFPDLATDTPGDVSIEVDNAPSTVFTGFKPGEILTVVDPVSHIPETAPGITGRPPAMTGDVIRIVDSNGDGTADSFQFLPSGTQDYGLTIRGVIDGVGTEPHTYQWSSLAVVPDITGPNEDKGIFNLAVSTADPGHHTIHVSSANQGDTVTVKISTQTITSNPLIYSKFLVGRTLEFKDQSNVTVYGVIASTPVLKTGFIELTLGDLQVPATVPNNFTHLYIHLTDRSPVRNFRPGEYLLVDDVPQSGKVPGAVSGAGGKPVAVGDWLVAVDTDRDNTPDTWHLLPMKTQAKASIFYFTADANADHATRWSLADLIDDTKVPVKSWVVVADDVNQQAPAGLAWVDVDGNDYAMGTINPPRGSIAQKIASKQFIEHWRPEQQWTLHVTAPPGRPFHTSYAWFNNRQWDWFKVGGQYVVGEVTNGMLPAMAKFPSLNTAQPATPGDVLVPVDKNNDGIADDVVLVRQRTSHVHTPAESTPATTGYVLIERFKGDTKTDIISDAWAKGKWDILITGQTRADTDLYLNLHATFTYPPDDSPLVDRRTPALQSVGPWHVRSGRVWSVHIVGHVTNYSTWQITFSGQDVNGKRIFDVQTLEDNSGGARLPVIGMDSDAGGLYVRAVTTQEGA